MAPSSAYTLGNTFDVLAGSFRRALYPADKVQVLEEGWNACYDEIDRLPLPDIDKSATCWKHIRDSGIIEDLLITLMENDLELSNETSIRLWQESLKCLAAASTAGWDAFWEPPIITVPQAAKIVNGFFVCQREVPHEQRWFLWDYRYGQCELINRLIWVYGKDSSFRDSISRDDMVEYIGSLFFEDQYLDTPILPENRGTDLIRKQERKIIGSCTWVLEICIYGPTTTEGYANGAASRLVRRYGLHHIFTKLLGYLTDDPEKLCLRDVLVIVQQLCVYLLYNSGFKKKLASSGLVQAFFRRYWEWCRLRGDEDPNFAQQVLIIVPRILDFFSAQNDDDMEMKAEIVVQLLNNDFMFITGKACMTESESGTMLGLKEDFSDMVKHVAPCIWRRNDNMNGSCLAIQLLHVEYCMRRVKQARIREHVDLALEGWRWATGNFINFPFDRLYQAGSKTVHDIKSLEVSPGCSHLYCPLYRDTIVSTGRTMMLCSHCRKVQYCSLNCQKLDWKLGSHRGDCSGRTHEG